MLVMMKKQISALVATLSMLGAANAAPVVFDAVGDTALTSYSSALYPTLAATVRYSLTAISGSTATFQIVVKNNSSGSGNNELIGFGITNITPDLVGVVDNNTDWDSSYGALSLGGQTVEFCSRFGGETSATVGCGSSVIQGLEEGKTNTMDVTMSFGSAFSTVRFDDFVVRFTQIGSTNAVTNLLPVSGVSGITFFNAVPEPGSLALAALALLAVPATRRLRR